MDLSSAGLGESIIKFVKICLWVAVCAMLTYIYTIVSGWKPSTPEFIMVQGLLNAFLPSLIQWVTTKE